MVPQNCIERNATGDCWRACLATITGLSAETMPNFMHIGTADGDEARAIANDWLRPHGFAIFYTWCNGKWDLQHLLDQMSKPNPGTAFILSGWSDQANDHHAVVCLNGEIVHDPSGAGLSAPAKCNCAARCDFRSWSVEVVSPLAVMPSADPRGLQMNEAA